jgi:hypothetical protein
LIDEAFDMKLAQDKLLATAIIAKEPPILVNLPFGILLLRRINGFVVGLLS